MKQKHNTKVIPNTDITVKEFKELIYDKFNIHVRRSQTKW